MTNARDAIATCNRGSKRPVVVLAGLLMAGCGSEPPRPPQQPPTVVVAKIVQRDVAGEMTYTGRIEAVDKVQLRARVQGFLVKRNFEEGADVKKDQVLYEIDKQPFEIAVKQAEANVANADAALQLAQVTFDRQQDLAERNSAAASKALLDQTRAGLAQAQAQKQVRQAELRTALLNLGYASVQAPFDGRAGRSAYSVGDLVGPSSNPLLTIVAQDPMYVSFPVPQRVLLDVRKSNTTREAFFVQIRLADGSIYKSRGELRFAEVQATSSTDSVIVRASIPNPDRLLVDQQLAEVMVVRKQADQRLMMPQSALLLDQQGAYTLVVGPDRKVALRRIVAGAQTGPLMIVEQGLQLGEDVVVSGHQNARPGTIVAPQSAEAAAGAAPARPQSTK
jgi:membrane fusion protein (multidrug efflux system)